MRKGKKAISADLIGKWALVTGASSGLGVDFARQLAQMGCNLILIARREELLQEVAAEVAGAHGVQAEVIALDLAQPDAPQQLYDRLQADGKQVDVLVNNAGFGLYGEFIALDWERERDVFQVNMLAVAHLTKLFLRDMVARDSGYILQMSSIGAYLPSPLYATYSATKAFVQNFSEAVHYELRNTGVSVTVVSPGIVRTSFHDVAGQQYTLYQRMVMMESADVVRIGLKAMLKRRSSVVPGYMNALSIWSMRFIPRRVQAALGYATMK
jgi:uncharacterized protein